MTTSTIRVNSQTKSVISAYAKDREISQTVAAAELIQIAVASEQTEMLLNRISTLEKALANIKNHVAIIEDGIIFGDD